MECCNEFFNNYLDFLKFVSENISANKKLKINNKKFNDRSLDYYKYNKFFNFINNIKNELDFDFLIKELDSNRNITEFFGKNLDLVNQLKENKLLNL